MKRIAMAATSLIAVGVLAGALVGVTAAASEPMADAGLDQTVTVGTAVQLDGTGSVHPAGALSSYEWTVRTPEGGEIAPSCRNCSRSQFTPGLVGRYEVRLAVTGPDGERRTDTMYVYVQNAGPDVELDGSRSPDSDSPTTYTATAESRNAELAEIAWAVQDEIVALRPLDGTTDESSLSFSFQGDRTYRVQVVVRDTNGRTAYDQLIVGPGSEDVGAVSWEETEATGSSCADPGFRASNPDVCEPEETPEANDNGSNESPSPETELIYFESN